MEVAEFIAKINIEGLDEFIGSLLHADQAFASFVGSSVEEAIKIQRLEASFGALSHSMEQGTKQMDYLRQYARTSVNVFDDLAAASKRLEAAGLNSGHFIKMVDILGGLKGTGAQGLNQIADALSRIASGANMGQAMRQFSSIGIGYNDLRAEGIDVSKSNHIKADPAQVIGALEKIFQRKFGDMGDYLQNTMSVKFANLQDAWNNLTYRFGEQWFGVIDSILGSVTKFVNYLGFSGEIDKIGKAFANAFGEVFNIGKGNGLEKFLAYTVATIEYMPQILQNVGKAIIQGLQWAGTALTGFLNSFAGGVITVFNNVKNGIEPIINSLRSMIALAIDYTRFFVSGRFAPGVNTREMGRPLHMDDVKQSKFENIGDAVGRVLNDMLTYASSGKVVPGDLARRGEEIYKASQSFIPPVVKNPEGDDMFNKNHIVPDKLDEIEKNTAKVAAHMEAFKRFALGGGDRANGIAVSEMYGRAGSGPRSLSINVSGAHGSALHAAISQIALETIQDYRRGGGH